MTGKHKIARRILALVLCAALVLPMGGTGIAGIFTSEVWSSLFPTAQAATELTASSYDQLKARIEEANKTTGQVIIKMGSNWSAGFVDALPAITGNVVLDLNGKTIKISAEGTGKDQNNSDYQIPNGNRNNDVRNDTLPDALITVNAGATLQVINSSATAGKFLIFTTFTLTNNGNWVDDNHTIQTSANMINCAGTLIIGDIDSAKNNFTLHTGSHARITATDSTYGCSAYSTAITATLNGQNAVLKMYGGTVSAEAAGRITKKQYVEVRCYPLNIEKCKSAEIYGGSVNILHDTDITGVDNHSGIYNNASSGEDAAGHDNYFTAIRYNNEGNPYYNNLYIFDVDSTVETYVGKNTKNAPMYTANIWDVNTTDGNAPFVMGGSFKSTSGKDDTDVSDAKHYFIYGNGNTSSGGSWNADTFSNKTAGTYNLFTLFYTADALTKGNISGDSIKWYGHSDYKTFADWVANAYDATYDANTATYSDAKTYGVGKELDKLENVYVDIAKKYIRTAYTHDGWKVVMPVTNEVIDTKDISNAATFGGTGGTVFIQPTWTPTNYKVTFDPNGTKAPGGNTYTDAYFVHKDITYNALQYFSKFYNIEGTANGSDQSDKLPEAFRTGYTFNGWEVVEKDTDSNWVINTENPVLYPANCADTANKTLKGMWGEVSLKANWTPTQYTVTFDTDGGEAIASRQYNIETGLENIVPAVKTGYTFQRWDVASCSGAGLTANRPLPDVDKIPVGVWGNVTLKAVYTPNRYKVTFDLNGGNALTNGASQSIVTFDSPIGQTYWTEATKTGYDFAGWSTNREGTDRVAPEDLYKFAKDTTLYATWTAGGYKVYFYYFNSENYKTEFNYPLDAQYDAKYSINRPLPIPPANTKPGWDFIGWYTDPVGGTLVTDDTIYRIAGNSELYARFEKGTYSLNFDVNGGTAVDSITYTIDKPITLPVSTKDGYSLRWKALNSAGEWKQDNLYAPVEFRNAYGNVNFVAVWTPVDYTVSLNANGGNVNPAAVTYTVEQATELPVPSRAGYKFVNWTVEIADGSFTQGQEVASVEKGNFGNITLKANWQPVSYTLIFKLNGGSYNDSTLNFETTYTIEDTLEIIEPVRTAYTFVKWQVEDINVGNWFEKPEISLGDTVSGKYGDVTLVAHWSPIQYTSSFNTDGGSVHDHFSTYNTVQNRTLPASEKAGYTLLGWKPDVTAGNWLADVTYPADHNVNGMYGNVSFTAQWAVDSFTATLDANEGELDQTSVSFTILSDTVLPTPERDGYAFTGWKVSANSGSWTKDKVISAIEHGNYGDVTLVAQWTLNKYDATFYSQNTLQPGMTMEDYDIETGLVLPEMPAREHYVFKGWIPAVTVGSWVQGTTYEAGEYANAWGTVRFDADWAKETYSVTWKNGDAVLETDTVEYGETPVYNGETPTKEADEQYTYTFAGWEPVVGAADKDIVYNAVFTKTVNTYTVTWVIESESSTATFAYGTMPVFDGIPVKESAEKYQFIGWFTAENEGLAPVTGDVTYIAKFVEITDSVKVTWIVDGNEYVTYGQKGQIPVFYGSTEKADENGYRYTFTGDWSLSEGGEKVEIGALDGEAVYYALFDKTAINYTATLRVNGGTLANDRLDYNVEGSIVLPVPVRNGYTFAGWKTVVADGNWTESLYVSGEYSEKFGNVELEAQWTATEYTVTVYPENGAAACEIIYTVDGTEALPAVSREGYTFTGWYVVSADGSWQVGQILDLNTALAGKYGNLTVQAQWQINRYTITWIIDGTSFTETYAYGTAVTQRNAPEKTGYIAAWDIGKLPQVMPANNLVISAVYTRRDYTISYNVNGGEMPETYVTVYNITSVDALPVPTRQGSLFAGWQVISEGGNWILNTTTAVSATLAGRYGNVTLKAVWTPTIHAITWVVDGVERIAHWYYGAKPSYDGIPEKKEDAQYTYTFIGWDQEIVKVTGDATYVAQFKEEIRSYTITWMNEDKVLLTQTYAYGEKPEYTGERPLKPSNELFAYEFEGWSPAVGTVVGAQTYYAQYKVYRFVQSVAVNYTDVTLGFGETLQLTASVYPENADYPNVKWFSNDIAVATVDSNGLVTAVGVGVTEICVQSLDNPALIAMCIIRVSPIYVEWLEITTDSVTRLPVGQTIQFGYILHPDNATNLAVNWVTKNADVAIVNENGLVTIVGAGTTQIYCYSADGFCSSFIDVTGLDETTDDSEEEKTVIVWFPFSQAAGGYIVNGQTLNDGTVRIPYGSDISFKLVNSGEVTVKVNGSGAYYPDENGYYTVTNVTEDISILVFSSSDNNLDDEITNNPQPQKSFFEKLGEFFRKIVLWFRSLFGMN